MPALRRRLPALLLLRRPAALRAVGCERRSPQPQSPSRPHAGQPTPTSAFRSGTGFDFYVLSLSWSPSYCEAEGDDANRQQCEAARPYAFVVHGLWPQFERGFPQECATDEPKVPQRDAARALRHHAVGRADPP